MNFYMMNVFQSFKSYKEVILLVAFTFCFGNVNACDLCGCSTTSGSSSFGDLSMSNFIGFRYIHQQFESRDGIFENSPKSEERFNTYQLWGRFPINQNFYISTIIPFQDLTRNFKDRSEHLSGLGDVNVIGWYAFKFYKKETQGEVDFNATKERSNHALSLGLGIKFPTGKFEEELADKVNPGFQIGTGSLDVFPTIMYTFNKNNFGIVANATYYFKSENKNDYKFGNQISYATSLFYSIDTKRFGIKPFLEISGDRYDTIEQFGETLKDTDGRILNGSFGSEFNRGKFVLGFKFTFPIEQDLLNGTVESQKQMSMYLNVSI